ncbi:tRNA (adenosine(37)-N6)-threonylcarbamoyltransferase complex dimerization subunit type 1 TsaB [Cellulomonas denverensis]|uniref:tRNA (Adenosine(37)-N6)-threonylcarbamoyltransferase complex dimerization subunit type 1 TsaB n=1 Tax=Cellulomonas denverensis TaxID=264297 RepID=A0A7X6KWN3_9CELL|nr:tRNA (adenosine(37)-N6)-threonylcarbamoyltransferase complex dimerization subunit type 1 TsaB [Cellulomonas denverensis]NKY23627.1 tRNA (adenosine(37)-N6)-threonylcarbamoyltransferase complex dimerization subunit type 1 TsaB [Cellulomonas denverensis]GIG26893.1 tRNA (adenosine(37)-N6)-threonylcarbamoyltransferase complex dimerization subunit type 1 TsaB [Cellulomonas denverensis]
MPLLALDTSSAASAAVLADDGATLATRSSGEPRRHAELLTPLIERVLAESGVDRTELTAIVAGTGPAPFTGLRVGLVTARTLGLALDVPVYGVSSLDALAGAALDLPEAAQAGEVLVVTDARRKEVYWARYRAVVGAGAQRSVELVDGPGVDAPAVLAERGLDGVLVVGPGTALYPELLPAGAQVGDLDPAELGRVALARLAEAVAASPDLPLPEAAVQLPTEPLYLRRPDAVPPPAAKRASA